MYIRRATPADVEGILRITREAFELYQEEMHSEYRISALSETADTVLENIGRDRVFVAIQNRRIYGCIRVRRLSPDLAYIYRFAVDPDEHNAGVGTKLIEHAVESCIEENMGAIALHTNARYFRLARYYYGKRFYVHSTDSSRGYIRALFVKELDETKEVDLTPAQIL